MSDVESARYWLSWLALGSKIAIVLVIIGVGYEFIDKRFGEPLHKVIDDAKDAEIAAANERAEQANRAAADSNRIAAEANERAAKANEIAEQERLERIKIQQQLAWRNLSPEAETQLTDELKGLGKQRVEVFALLNHDEVVWIRDQIVAAMRQAGWDARPNANRRVPSGIINGILIEVALGASPEIRKIASALGLALQHVGLQASGPTTSYSLVSDAPMEVLVGNKP